MLLNAEKDNWQKTISLLSDVYPSLLSSPVWLILYRFSVCNMAFFFRNTKSIGNLLFAGSISRYSRCCQ